MIICPWLNTLSSPSCLLPPCAFPLSTALTSVRSDRSNPDASEVRILNPCFLQCCSQLSKSIPLSCCTVPMSEADTEAVSVRSMLLPFPRLSALSACVYRIIYCICQLQLFTVTAQSGAVFSLNDRFLFRLLIWC